MTNFKSIVCFALFCLGASLACKDNLPENLKLVWANEKYVGVYNTSSQHAAFLDYVSNILGFINGPEQRAFLFNLNTSTYLNVSIQWSEEENLMQFFTETSSFDDILQSCCAVSFGNITLQDLVELTKISQDTGFALQFTLDYLESISAVAAEVSSELNDVLKGFYIGNDSAKLPIGMSQMIFINIAISHLFSNIPGGLPELVQNGFQWNLTHIIESGSAAQALVRILLQLSETHRLESILGNVLDDSASLLTCFGDFAFGAQEEIDGLLTVVVKIMQFENTGSDSIEALISSIKMYFTSTLLNEIPEKVTAFVKDMWALVHSQQEQYGSEDLKALEDMLTQYASGDLFINGVNFSTVASLLLSNNIPSIIQQIGSEIGVDVTTC